MKVNRFHILILFIFVSISQAYAVTLYTWTDADGVVHITETPPPEGARLNEVKQYEPQSEEEILRIKSEQEMIRKEREKEQILQDSQKAKKKAEEARSAADEAKIRAEVANQRFIDLKEKVGTDTDDIKRNRSRLRKLEMEALKAMDTARQTTEQAVKAEEEAKEAELRAMEILKQDQQP